MALIKSYFSLLEKYKAKYGDTFLLMQVGSFYEVYSTKDNDPDILYFSKLCDLKIAQKNEYFMAGFRDYMIDKYIQKLSQLFHKKKILFIFQSFSHKTWSRKGVFN